MVTPLQDANAIVNTLHSHPGQVWYRSFKNTQRLWILSLIPYKKITKKNMDRLTFTTRIRHWRYSLDWWWELLIGKFPCIEQRKKNKRIYPPWNSQQVYHWKVTGSSKKIFQRFIFSGEQLVSGRGTRWAPTSFKGAALKMSFIPQGVEELLIFLRYLMFSYGHILLSLHPFLPHDGGVIARLKWSYNL